MMAVNPMGKPAVTHYRVAERFRAHTRLRCRLETGRTHQIRVHLAHEGHPLVADVLYGGRPLRGMQRQALHAAELAFAHPITREPLSFEAPMPADMAAAWQQVLAAAQ